MRQKSPLGALGAFLAASVLFAQPELLPDTIADVSRQVEEVRGRKFQRPVPAFELDPAETRRVLREKIIEGLPAPPDDAFRSLAAVGLIDDPTRMLDILVDFYASQVVAFYDPKPRRFYVVKGAEGLGEAGAEAGDLASGLIYSHELTHALQDETLRLDDRIRELRDDGDRIFALQCLLEGEATLVMVRVALEAIPGAAESLEEQMVPLLSAGALERSNVPKDVPDYFVDQLFFPYTDGTAFVRAAVKRGGWAEMDRLWKSPPLSSAEILHGSPYPPPAQGLLPANLAKVAPGARFVYSDTLGEWTMRFLLGRALSSDEAAKAAAGWRGDRIAYFAGPGAMSYLWRIRFDEPASAARFEAALRKARAKRPVPSPETIALEGKDVVVSSGLPAAPRENSWLQPVGQPAILTPSAASTRFLPARLAR